MEFLLKALDDANPQPCGRCANCQGKGFTNQTKKELLLKAENFLKGSEIIITPRKLLPTGLMPGSSRNIPDELQNDEGRALSYYGDSGWGKLVREGKYVDGWFCDELVDAAAELIINRWNPSPFPEWVTSIPSNRHPELVPCFASRLADKLGLRSHPVFSREGNAPEQKTMMNSFTQAGNVYGSLMLSNETPPGCVLLVDDIIDSKWTMTIAGYLLKQHGVDRVFPFTLAMAQGKR
jgi:ATP-dependent DNA helicase RecQ